MGIGKQVDLETFANCGDLHELTSARSQWRIELQIFYVPFSVWSRSMSRAPTTLLERSKYRFFIDLHHLYILLGGKEQKSRE
jgi:hypothetical protein